MGKSREKERGSVLFSEFHGNTKSISKHMINVFGQISFTDGHVLINSSVQHQINYFEEKIVGVTLVSSDPSSALQILSHFHLV